MAKLISFLRKDAILRIITHYLANIMVFLGMYILNFRHLDDGPSIDRSIAKIVYNQPYSIEVVTIQKKEIHAWWNDLAKYFKIIIYLLFLKPYVLVFFSFCATILYFSLSWCLKNKVNFEGFFYYHFIKHKPLISEACSNSITYLFINTRNWKIVLLRNA